MDSPEQSGFLKSLSHKIYGTLLIKEKFGVDHAPESVRIIIKNRDLKSYISQSSSEKSSHSGRAAGIYK